MDVNRELPTLDELRAELAAQRAPEHGRFCLALGVRGAFQRFVHVRG